MDSAPLDRMQLRLETIYEVDLADRVVDFLITDPDVACVLDTSVNARQSREKLLVQEDGDDLRVGLYLDRDVVDRLQRDDPSRGLHNENLDTFCLAMEGVSHFLYVAYNAKYERAVSLMELELQAEVDKYVCIASLLNEQGQGYKDRRLRTWLFEDVSYDKELDARQLYRYQQANSYAARYCEWLSCQYPGRRRNCDMLNELRRFYRKTQGQKMHRISHACRPSYPR